MKKIIKLIYLFIFGGVAFKVGLHLRLAKRFPRNKVGVLFRRYLHVRMQRYGMFVSEKATIEADIKFPHPTGIVIGEGVIIGKNTKIYQNVTLGGARVGDAKEKNYPTVGDGVVIFAGAVIVGKVNIGSNAIIGANSVVLSDVPENATCVGVPGRIINIQRLD